MGVLIGASIVGAVWILDGFLVLSAIRSGRVCEGEW